MKGEDDFGFLALDVVGDVMHDELLLETPQVKVAAVSKQLSPVVMVAYMGRVTAQEMKELGEGLGGAIWNAWWSDGRGSEEASTSKTGKDLFGRVEERTEAKREEIGGVAGGGKDGAGNLEIPFADLDEDFRFEELFDELWYYSLGQLSKSFWGSH